ncbi:MAG: GGDEF domain-containing protein, partial [Acidimicrobiales bacterium]
RRLNSCLRTDDLAGRWGGEEFLLLLPATELGGAWTLADRVRRLIADTPISVPGGEALVTMSAGCADGDGADLEDQLRRAESALDAAKASGRNRVMTDPTATS